MKHEFLRRLSALALALVMAASLCVTPAWADEGDEPDRGQFGISSELIVLENASKKYQLVVSGVIPGDYISWTIPSGVTVTYGSQTATGSRTFVMKVEEPAQGQGQTTTCTVDISAAMGTSEGVMYICRSEENGTPITGYSTCYVYCGTAPIDKPNIPDLILNVPYKLDFSFTTSNEDVIKIFQKADIKFNSLPAGFAEIKKGATTSDKFTAEITPNQTGRFSVEMILPGGYPYLWTNINVREVIPNPVTFIGIQESTVTLTAGETYTMQKPTVLSATSKPTNSNILWSIDNTNIATIDPDSGKITAKAEGETVIIATAADGSNVTAQCPLYVKESDSKIELTTTRSVLNADVANEKTATITATLSGKNSTSSNTTIKWTSNNTSFAALQPAADGKTATITALKAGSVRVTATATFKDADGKTTATKSAYCDITILNKDSVKLTSLTLSETSHTMPADGSFTLSVTSVTPSAAPDKRVKWTVQGDSTEDPKIIKVDPDTGKVTAIGPGQAAVVATAIYGNASKFCTVTVTPTAETIRLTSMPNLVNTSVGSGNYRYTMQDGVKGTLNVTAVLTPTGAADPIHWVSKNPGIATVESSASKSTQAKITGVTPGKTTITAVPMDPTGKDRVLSSGPIQLEVTVSGLAIEDAETHPLSSLSLMEGQQQQLVASIYGSASNGDNSVDWTSYNPSVAAISTRQGASTMISARAPGTTTITARKGSYMATLTVTVLEDTVGVIEGTTTPGAAYQFSKLASQLQSACSAKTGKSLAYITNLAVSSTDQGILHDQHYSSEDTGAGVGRQDRYYPGTAPQGQRSLNDLSFVPRNTFSGTAEISYTAWSTDNKSFPGVIRITVNGTGDVSYSSGDGSPVTFSAEDFNYYHPNIRSVSFTPPLNSVGTLYYNYTSATQPGTKVASSDSYSRSGTPSLNRVTFVPNAGYQGTVKIAYKGTDTAGRAITGTVTITVNKPSDAGANTADVFYDLPRDRWVTLRAADFSTACQRTLGESLAYVRFNPPQSSDGTLFYNYRGFSDFDSMVASTTSYYYSGTPALSGVSFVPITTTPSQVDIDYTGYTTRGNTFTGTIHIGQNGSSSQQSRPSYTVVTGQTVSLRAGDLNALCIASTGASLSYVQFTQLPAVSQGTLRYTRGNTSTPYSVTTGTRFFYTGTGTYTELIGNVYFQAGTSIGTVTIPFTGYNTNNVSFTDVITIQVTPPTTTYSGTTSSPFRLSSSQISSTLTGSLGGTLSYITFTNLPSAAAGRLYSGYSGFGTGSQVNTGTRYYVSGSPGIDQLSFVPKGRYNGQVTIGYTATNTNNQSVNGQIVFNISSSGSSKHFYDLAYHTWAAPAVDYLYENGVTKGITATTYGPNQPIQRCDFVLMLVRALNLTGSGGYSFPDVPANEYFAQAVAIARQRGIVNGDNGYFKPYSPVTRQDAMVIIKNALAASGRNLGSASTSILGSFSDGAAVSSYARDAVSTLVQLGAVNGDNGRLLPHNSITRAEAAVILHFVMTM